MVKSTEVRTLGLNSDVLQRVKERTSAETNREAISRAVDAWVEPLGALLAAIGMSKLPLDNPRPRRIDSETWKKLTAWAASAKSAEVEDRGGAVPLDTSATTLVRAVLQLTAEWGIPDLTDAAKFRMLFQAAPRVSPASQLLGIASYLSQVHPSQTPPLRVLREERNSVDPEDERDA